MLPGHQEVDLTSSKQLLDFLEREWFDRKRSDLFCHLNDVFELFKSIGPLFKKYLNLLKDQTDGDKFRVKRYKYTKYIDRHGPPMHT